MNSSNNPSFIISLIAGGIAGTTVDISLYPLDTLRTRLQSHDGFWKSGGFRNLYRGIGPAVIGSAPTAALFFCTYNCSKSILDSKVSREYQSIVHMTAAANGEVVSCLVKVPTEILKQRQQIGIYSSGIFRACQIIYRQEGFRGFYRGLSSTILREIPFSIIQFPLWEGFMVQAERWKGKTLTALDKALCGASAGGVAAALTTPIDVAKTRIMLFQKGMNSGMDRLGIVNELTTIYMQKGVKGMFAGFVPRVTWITIGGAVFFGSYEVAKDFCSLYL